MKYIIIFFVILGVCGCSLGSQRFTVYNQKTGKNENVYYSKAFEGEKMIIDENVKVFVTATFGKKSASDREAKHVADAQKKPVDFKFYIHNVTERRIPFKLESVQYVEDNSSDFFPIEANNITLIPQSVEWIGIEDRLIDSQMLEIKLLIGYSSYMGSEIKEIVLKRLTKKEYRLRKSKDWGYFWN